MGSPGKLLGVVPIPGLLWSAILFGVFVASVWPMMQIAFRIRTHAIKEFGLLIHEFDPWFNYRATQYLAKEGWYAFFHWFDRLSWYPLGRPVGTTIYPGLQITAVALYRVLKWLGPAYKVSLNYICCYIPCWGGAAATAITGLLGWEATGSVASGIFASVIMSVIPAHLMRSIGGGFDNESIGMPAIVLTFFLWTRALRHESSWPIGVLVGLCYGYMAAAWGGYVIVINMITLHAAILASFDFVRGRFSHGLHKAYSLLFIVGTPIAMCVPPVGQAPIRSLEQLSALVLFVILQFAFLAERKREARQLHPFQLKAWALRISYCLTAVAIMAVLAQILFPMGFFGPLSARVRGLFVQHTRTGNPLVDSVAEHQPASPDAFKHYLNATYMPSFYGALVLPVVALLRGRWKAGVFVAAYCVTMYYFCTKMARLILLVAPAASLTTGALFGTFVDICVAQLFWNEPVKPAHMVEQEAKAAAAAAEEAESREASPEPVETSSKKGKRAAAKPEEKKAKDEKKEDPLVKLQKVGAEAFYKLNKVYHALRLVRLVIAVAAVYWVSSRWQPHWKAFYQHADSFAHSMSNPQIVFKTTLNNGQSVIIDDYLMAYRWLKKNTPKDARVMAWWDYGYQITGIGERTSIADGNTWNHEHIATLGYCLTSPVKRAHTLIRHIADYVLVWAGGGGDDLAKSPHMARIGNSVYNDICPGDPTCSSFGFYSRGYDQPTPMMKKSLLYNLIQNGKGGRVEPSMFKEVHSTKYGLVRIFKVMNISEASKAWLADPANRDCDAPGSWYCPGNYPPAKPWKKLLSKRTTFAQIEDFNNKKKNEKYVNEYMKRMNGRG